MNTAAFSAARFHTDNRTEQPSNPLTAEQRMTEAVTRIESSRSALIVCLSPDPPERDDRPAGSPNDGSAEQSFAQTLAARIERNGLLEGSWRTLRALARRWWKRQPWHSSVDLVGQTLAHQARPLMQRHPLGTLAVGAAVGAGLVAVASAMRPWALHQIRGKASPWGSRVGSMIWTQLASAPVQMALAGALAAWLADQGSRNTQSSGEAAATRHTRAGDDRPGAEALSVP